VKAALMLVLVLWALVSLFSFAGLVYLFPSYVIVGALAEGFKTHENPDLLHWFYGCAMSLTIGVIIMALLWRTHRKHYGKLWKSN